MLIMVGPALPSVDVMLAYRVHRVNRLWVFAANIKLSSELGLIFDRDQVQVKRPARLQFSQGNRVRY